MSLFVTHILFIVIISTFVQAILPIGQGKTFSLTETLRTSSTKDDSNILAITSRHPFRYADICSDSQKSSLKVARIFATGGFVASFHVGAAVLNLAIDTGSSDL